MLIIQELYNGLGQIKTHSVICNSPPRRASKIIPQTNYTEVIIIGNYYMIFRSADLRDAAYNKIMASKENKVIISLDEFYPAMLNNEQVVNVLRQKNFQRGKTFSINVDRILRTIKTENKMEHLLKNVDAFRNLSQSRLKALQAGKKFHNDEIKLFSKTLYFPKEFTGLFTPTGFWTALNEL